MVGRLLSSLRIWHRLWTLDGWLCNVLCRIADWWDSLLLLLLVLAQYVRGAGRLAHWGQAAHLVIDVLSAIGSVLTVDFLARLRGTLNILILDNSFFPRKVLRRSHLVLWNLVVKVVLEVSSSYVEVVHWLREVCAWAAASSAIGGHRLLHCINLLSPCFSARGVGLPLFWRGPHEASTQTALRKLILELTSGCIEFLLWTWGACTILTPIECRYFSDTVCAGLLVGGQGLQISMRYRLCLAHFNARIACVLGVSVNWIPARWLNFLSHFQHWTSSTKLSQLAIEWSWRRVRKRSRRRSVIRLHLWIRLDLSLSQLLCALLDHLHR